MSQNAPTIHKIFLSIAILCLVGYAFFNSRFLIQGPEIVLANVDPHSNTVHTSSKDFSLQGTVKHSSFITINDRPIMIDESGRFNEKLLLSSGVSIIDIYARDKFGKETREKIDVVYASEPGTSTVDTYTKIALRAQENSSSTSDETKEEPVEVVTLSTTSTLTASSSIMTILPSATSSEF